MKTSSLGRFIRLCTVLPAFAVGTQVSAIVDFYELSVFNNFGTGEYYGATPGDADIWILSNFKFDYKKDGDFVTGNATAGSYGTAIQLSEIQDGSIRLYSQDTGTRMYAVLSQGATAPTHGDVDTMPNNYFEWSFNGGNPGTLDLSWIDSFDFLSRMHVDAKGSTTPAPTTAVFGASGSTSTNSVGHNLHQYVHDGTGRYTWLGTSGYSKPISYDGAPNAVRWITNNSGTTGAVNAHNIGSFTHALDKAIDTAATKPAWSSGTPADGPNWTDKGFRVSNLQGVNPPDGSSLGAGQDARMWSAYVSFTKNGSGEYTLTLTDFTIYGLDGGPPASGQYVKLWNAVDDAGGATYSVDQSQGMLDAVWTSSTSGLTSVPSWITNLGDNSVGFWYAVYNAIASGVIYDTKFVNDTTLPEWGGYVPYVDGQAHFNFEVLTKGAAVTGGLNGYLTGTDLVALMTAEHAAGDLVNPYFLELLGLMEQTPAYLYPSQDFWNAISLGADDFIGIQPGPLNSDAVFGDATFEWYLGSGVAIPEPGTTAAFLGALSLVVVFWVRRSRK